MVIAFSKDLASNMVHNIEYRGRGVVTSNGEPQHRLAQHCFHQCGISYIQIKCAAGNIEPIEHKKLLKQSRKSRVN